MPLHPNPRRIGRRPLRSRFFPVFAPVAWLAASPLGAQDIAPLTATESAAPTATFPEVLVLGEALENPQEKPVSATFLSDQDVEAFRLREPQDIVRLAPNYSATDSGSRSFGDVYSVRGLTNTVFFGAPATTIYVDDVPFGETFSYAQRLGAINSVEVLRGPQPTVVGRNTYGGLINVRSRRPTNRYEGSFNYSYGSYESHLFDGWVMGPIVQDQLFFRIGGMFDSRQGYLRDARTGERLDDTQHWGINGGLFWRPARGWEISLTASYDRYDDGAPRLTSLDRDTGFFTVGADVDGVQHRTTDNQALRISYEGSKYKFLSVTSRRWWNLDPYIIDLDFTDAPFGSSHITQDQEIWSQELRFSTNDPSAAFQWNIGAYGSISTINGTGLRRIYTQQTTLTPFTDVSLVDISPYIGLPPGSFYQPVTTTGLATSLTDVNMSQLTTHTIEEKAFAFYAGGSWSGWDPVTFHAGLRFDYIERDLTRNKKDSGKAVTNTVATGTSDFPAPGTPIPPQYSTLTTPLDGRSPHIGLKDDWFHVTPTLGIDVKLTDDALIYAKTTYAFKPGGFSAYADDIRYVPYDEEKTWATEIGVKARWLDGKLITNLAGFWNEIEDYQVERSFTLTDYAVFNARKARAYGVELESRYEIAPPLDFYGSIGWTHARLRDYTDPVTGQSLDGVTPPFVPEFDAAVALDFHLEKGFFTRVEYLVQGDTWYDDFNRSDFKQNTFGLLNAAIGWRAKNWSLVAYATNLTGEKYYTNMNTDVRTGAPGAPREYGVKVGFTF